ncbi:MAG TPA: heparin lyase I family protein [Bauldia sp.]|nr:heparin lyase I family protein [Bauldia sp.]
MGTSSDSFPLDTIGGFSSASGTEFTILGESYRAQNGNAPWSLSNPQPDTLRFELRPGDVWGKDPQSRERSEIAGDTIFAAGKNLSVSYDFMVEPGAPNTAEWLVIGQFHAADNFRSPCLAVELIGERLAIRIRSEVAGQPQEEWLAFIDDEAIERGRYYHLQLELHFEDHGDHGAVLAWLDGEPIVHYAGNLGHGYGTYWKEGIYRSAAAETLAVNFRNLTISGETGVRIYGTDQSDRIAPNKPLPGQPDQTDEGDIIYGLGRKDWIRGADGHDLLFGGSGDDRLQGGGESDTLVGEGGDDRLKGGPGYDVFRFDSQRGSDVILDFKNGIDLIAVNADLFTSGEPLESHLRKVRGGVVLDVGDSQLFVKGVRLTELNDGNDFLFV